MADFDSDLISTLTGVSYHLDLKTSCAYKEHLIKNMFSQALHYLAFAGHFLTVFSQTDGAVVPNLHVRQTFTHPGLLQSSADFTRIQSKVNQKVEPWNTAWNQFLQSGYTNPSYTPNPVAIVYRGSDGVHAENYGNLYTDIAAAYALAVRWAITGDTQVGDAAVRIMDAWSSTLTQISGNNDQYLAAGIYGYEFASAAEIMRSYGGWPAANFLRFQNMMLQVFYPLVNGWFTQHSQWAENANAVYPGWDLCIIASAMAIGVLSDNRAIYNQGVSWYQNGTGNGNIHFAVPFTHTVDNEVMGQLLESGRDQGHAHLDIALLGVIGQIAYNQGDDLFGYDGNIILEA